MNLERSQKGSIHLLQKRLGEYKRRKYAYFEINSPYSGLGVSLINFDLVFAFLFSIP